MGPFDRNRTLRLVLLVATLAGLLFHARLYAFTTDDAFISYRYARNLADGHGLVFNPGMERVEGYTNLLWVLLLAAGAGLGVDPERAAPVLSIGATVALWGVVAAFAWRRYREDVPLFVPLLPTAFLAATRTVAVWSTGGLETRLFEALGVAGVLRLSVELEGGGARPRPLSGILLGLAAITRPEGALFGGAAIASGFLLASSERRRERALWIARVAGFVLPPLAQLLFRLAYYGEWLPNTYHAKVGGRVWWDVGGIWLGGFLLEHAAWLWLPALAAAAIAARGRLSADPFPALAASSVLPMILFAVSIGGDHFEYRPLGLAFPFLALLLADGLARLARAPRGRVAAPLLALATAWGLLWLPTRSRIEYPEGYLPGFPGGGGETVEAETFLDPARDPVYRLPGLRFLGRAHREALRRSTAAFVGIRQEEHRAFLESLRPQAERLRTLVAAGTVPADLSIALSSVGIVPYYADLPTVDRLGLTDAFVARLPSVSAERAMGHEKRDTLDYARRRGVHLSSLRAGKILYAPDDPDLLGAIVAGTRAGLEVGWAEPAPGDLLVGTLPLGLDATRRALPSLEFRAARDPAAFGALAARAASALRARADRGDADPGTRLALGQALLLSGEAEEARRVLERLLAERPRTLAAWTALAGARALVGDRAGALAAADAALALARERGAGASIAEIEAMRARLGQGPPRAR